jgi:hypothetical protein
MPVLARRDEMVWVKYADIPLADTAGASPQKAGRGAINQKSVMALRNTR